jgi:hypothetical protein
MLKDAGRFYEHDNVRQKQIGCVVVELQHEWPQDSKIEFLIFFAQRPRVLQMTVYATVYKDGPNTRTIG